MRCLYARNLPARNCVLVGMTRQALQVLVPASARKYVLASSPLVLETCVVCIVHSSLQRNVAELRGYNWVINVEVIS